MAGQVQFKADRFGMVHVGVGKANFPLSALLENVRVLMVRLLSLGGCWLANGSRDGWAMDEARLTSALNFDQSNGAVVDEQNNRWR